MKLRLSPRQEDAYFPLFEAAADTIAAAATALLDLLTDLADPETKAKQLAELEHEGDRITRTILTRLASTFIARLDRDDIFELAERLDNVTDAIEDVGDMVFLHGITQPLDPVTEQARVLLRAAEHTSQGMRSLDKMEPDRLNAYLTAIDDLEHEGDQLHRRVRAQLYDFTGEHPAQHMLRWMDITDGIEQALDELAHVAHTVEGIVLKNA
jgi:predicted phosphate transport protein (TIGR00153 family)